MKSGAKAKDTAQDRHDLDDKALGQFLLNEGKIPDLRLPIKTSKIGYGQSNPTYFIDDAVLVASQGKRSLTNAGIVVRDTFSGRSHEASQSVP